MVAVLLGVFAALCWSVHDVLARSMPPSGLPHGGLVMVSGAILLAVLLL